MVLDPGPLVPVLVLGGQLSVGAALRSVGVVPPDTRVTVEEPRGPGPRRIHVLTAGLLQRGLPELDPTLDLATALGLSERRPAPVLDLGAEDAVPAPGTVVVDGPTVVGWVEPAGAGTDGRRGEHGAGHRGKPDLTDSIVPVVPVPDPVGSERPHARFRAFPRLSAPGEVSAGTPFTVRVGFGASSADSAAGPVVIADAPPVLTFEIQLSGFGFTFPSGATAALSVGRDDPVETVELEVIADAVRDPFVRTVEASYSLGGVPVGMAWCDVLVSPVDSSRTTPAHAVVTAPASGGSDLGLTDTEPADLTVTIRSEPGGSTLSWLFQTPYAVPRPTAPVITELSVGTAQAFATQLIAQLSKRKNDPFLTHEVRGIGDLVAEQMPPELWQVLADVLALVPPDRTPTVLLVLDEAYVPWELALVDGRIPAHLVPTGAEIPLLGCVFALGRWPVPRRRGTGHDRPSAPPPHAMAAPTMAVVVGDYTSSALRLEGALAECAALLARYDAVRVGIAAEEILALVEDALERDGRHYAPALVHFALHGQTSSDKQQYVGLKYGAKGERLLHPATLKMAPLTSRNRPFVFLNACQVGSAMATLDSMSGIAPDLVTGGARGVIGAFWDVDDSLAKDLSTTFYRETLEEAVPVGEAVRRIRATFARTPHLTATPLAYVYYGHPALRLDREPAADPDPSEPPDGATR